MGIFDLLSKEGRAKGKLESLIKKTTHKYVQSADRFAAMEGLKELGTEDALYGLCRRFSFVYDKTIEDEQEKQWVEDTLAGFGDRALPPLRRFMMQGETVAYPLRVLEKIATPEKVLEVVDELMAREEPGYTRHPERKVQLLGWLADWKAAPAPEEITRRIAPYLKDFDEGVRFAAIEALAHARPHEPTSRPALLEALLRPEEESRRILVRIAEILAERDWSTAGADPEALARLAAAKLPEFSLVKDRLVRKAR
jgi:hypothetical protein